MQSGISHLSQAVFLYLAKDQEKTDLEPEERDEGIVANEDYAQPSMLSKRCWLQISFWTLSDYSAD